MMAADEIGAIVTGALAARALEPRAGEAGASGHEGACLNCGTVLIGDYCHRCGQSGHVHRSLSAWWHDITHGVLHLDGKVWRTLPMLAFRPGELTRRYIDGERARFVSPISLFLFSVFLMFAVFSMVGGPFTLGGPAREASQALRSEIADVDRRIAELEQARERAAATGEPFAEIEERLSDARQERQVLRGAVRGFDPQRHVYTGPRPGEEGFQAIGFTTGIPSLDAAIEKANANPTLLIYKVQANAYKFSWALIPLSVPFVWLLFLWRPGHRVYDHTVFVTYSIAFMSLLLVAMSLLGPLGLTGGWIAAVLTLVPPLHIYKQLRGTYGLRRFSALWRTVAVLFFANMALMTFLLLLVALGALA
jgi:hypothetical protein